MQGLNIIFNTDLDSSDSDDNGKISGFESGRQ